MSKIEWGMRGVVNLPLGGQDRKLRFRTHEISLLEKRIGKGIMTLLSQEGVGMTFLKEAIIVGVAHEFQGKTKAGKKKTLTEKEVCRWIDNCEEKDGIEFEELMDTVLRAVVGGLPGGDRMLAQMDAIDDEEDEEEGDDSPPEKATREPTTTVSERVAESPSMATKKASTSTGMTP